ncbi:HpcH/HpaI aldolase family protein [Peribacillus sp. NPDC096540]|uniref:HpcH/HpaI aldolase family protein n=1 Tax=Peribacillus sp. NPDC096540 TaxID=3390612 RepID=UPI003490F1A0
MENKIKEKINQGESVLGTFFELGGTTAVECLGIAGLDFLIIDAEHGPFDVESSMDFMRAAELRGITPFVRVKDVSRSSILKMLDIGAKGIVAPCIDTIDQVKQLVEYGKYYPIGKRGFTHARAASYGFASFTKNMEEYFNICNEKTLIIPQCETQGCLDHIEEIVNIDGVDGIFIGPYDLSIGMGIPGQFADPNFVQAIERILKACKEAGKFAFIYSTDNSTAKKYLADGFDGVAINMDVSVYINAFKSIISEVRSK